MRRLEFRTALVEPDTSQAQHRANRPEEGAPSVRSHAVTAQSHNMHHVTGRSRQMTPPNAALRDKMRAARTSNSNHPLNIRSKSHHLRLRLFIYTGSGLWTHELPAAFLSCS